MKHLFKDPSFLSSVIETMSEGLMVVDPDGTILFFNRAAEEITGYSAGEVLGRRCTMLDTDTCAFTHGPSGGKGCTLFEDGRVTKKQCMIKKKDGRTVHLLKNAVVLRNAKGEVIGAVESMTDVTTLYMKEQEVRLLKNELLHEYGFMGLIGTSTVMNRMYEQIQNAATSEAPVLIMGESGTGKELVAHAIHRLGRRHKGPFVKVNCSALNEHLLESELFGHVKGAFTGAIRDRKGRFEAADGGSIFLDEIGDMPLSMQVKLLRVLQEKEFERVGDNRSISVNVRLITATNRDLNELVQKGSLREDFYYRINVIPITTPPLRSRRDDIPFLISHFLKKAALVNEKNIHRVSPDAMDVLESFHWPGNVRQLINVVEYAVMTSKNDTLEYQDLPDYLKGKTPASALPVPQHKKKDNLIAALQKYNGNRTLAAKHLGISRVTLWKMMKDFGLTVDEEKKVG